MFYEIREGSNRYKYFNGEETFLGHEKGTCPECGQFELNRLRPCPVAMDISSWNGLDVCRLGLYPHRLIVTEKVLAAARKAKLNGMAYAEESDILYALKSKKL